MGLNFDNLSRDDINRTENIRNPAPFDAGDNISSQSSGGDSSFDDIFSDSSFDDIFGSSGGNDDIFGGSSNSNDIFGGSSGNSSGDMVATNSGGFGAPNQFNNGFMNSFNGNSQQQAQVAKPDHMDKLIDYGATGVTNLSEIIVEMIKSIKNRTADDLGYYSTNLITTGAIGGGISVALILFSWLSRVRFIGINGISGTTLLAFTLTASTGIILMSVASYAIASADNNGPGDLRNLPDVQPDENVTNATNDYEEELGDIMSELFGDDSDNFEVNLDPPENEPDNPGFGIPDPTESPIDVIPEVVQAPQHIDFNAELAKVMENGILQRQMLVDTFIRFLPSNNPDFTKKKTIEEGSEDFIKIEGNCLKAMSNVLKCEIEEVSSCAESIVETFLSYEVKMKRIKGFNNNKLDELASEIESYVRDRPSDSSVSVSIDILGDYYYIVITKGISPIITLRDVFTQQSVLNFFKDEKNKLPIITGISELGEVIYDDAKVFDTMMISGKPRSGKSWYVLSILLSLMMFNTPEDVQFIIVDPKESNLFKTLSLMPHVAGLHNDDYILDIMDDIINIEAARRKRILAEHRCDDIWELRKKGIKMPILYLVIDEYITIKNKLAANKLDKDLDNRLQTIISQLPSQGIRIIFVPHRATGIVNKTNRTMLQFTASVKGDIEDINDTLGIKNWKRPLVRAGDIAIKTSVNPEPMYVRGAAITTSDAENSELIETVAKAFYKLGVDLVTWGSPENNEYMSVAINRNEEEVKERLGANNRIQYNASNVFND